MSAAASGNTDAATAAAVTASAAVRITAPDDQIGSHVRIESHALLISNTPCDNYCHVAQMQATASATAAASAGASIQVQYR